MDHTLFHRSIGNEGVIHQTLTTTTIYIVKEKENYASPSRMRIPL